MRVLIREWGDDGFAIHKERLLILWITDKCAKVLIVYKRSLRHKITREYQEEKEKEREREKERGESNGEHKQKRKRY